MRGGVIGQVLLLETTWLVPWRTKGRGVPACVVLNIPEKKKFFFFRMNYIIGARSFGWGGWVFEDGRIDRMGGGDQLFVSLSCLVIFLLGG